MQFVFAKLLCFFLIFLGNPPVIAFLYFSSTEGVSFQIMYFRVYF